LPVTFRVVSTDFHTVRAYRRRQSGTTLAELLVAIAFAGVATASILATTVHATRTARLAEERGIALSLAQESIENARKEARSLSLTEGSQDMVYTKDGEVYLVTAYDVNLVPSPPVTNTGIDGDVIVNREVALEPGTTDLFRVTVQATWPSRYSGSSGRTSLTLETYVRRSSG
jgi:type II secretory pathway pseudopilin PulG